MDERTVELCPLCSEQVPVRSSHAHEPWVSSPTVHIKNNWSSIYATPIILVRMKGLEPSRLAAPAPKAGVSTNSTTSAHS